VELIPTAEGSRRPRLEGHVALLTAQLAGAGLYLFAALGFGRKARAAGDELMQWLAVAALFGAFSRVNYFLYPSLYTELGLLRGLLPARVLHRDPRRSGS
jgi:hypothetical protein